MQGEVVGFKKRKLTGIISEIHEKFINLPDGTEVKAKDDPQGAYVRNFHIKISVFNVLKLEHTTEYILVQSTDP